MLKAAGKQRCQVYFEGNGAGEHRCQWAALEQILLIFKLYIKFYCHLIIIIFIFFNCLFESCQITAVIGHVWCFGICIQFNCILCSFYMNVWYPENYLSYRQLEFLCTVLLLMTVIQLCNLWRVARCFWAAQVWGFWVSELSSEREVLSSSLCGGLPILCM